MTKAFITLADFGLVSNLKSLGAISLIKFFLDQNSSNLYIFCRLSVFGNIYLNIKFRRYKIRLQVVGLPLRKWLKLYFSSASRNDWLLAVRDHALSTLKSSISVNDVILHPSTIYKKDLF